MSGATAVQTAKVTSPDTSIWSEILEQAAQTATVHTSNLLLLGGCDVGKSSMLKGLQKMGFYHQRPAPMELHQDVDSVAALDYAFLHVRNGGDSSESISRMNVWILQHSQHKELLRARINGGFLKNAAVMICLDLSKPWQIKDDLQHWLDFVMEFIQPEFKKLCPEDQETYIAKNARHVHNYRSSVERESAGDFAKRTAADETAASVQHAIKINLGLPIFVVVCKSDIANQLESKTTRGYLGVVEAHLRRLCLPYGASLIFCSGGVEGQSPPKNINTLYQYLMHRVHDFDFAEPAVTEPKENLFYPSGWDTEAELEQFVKSTIAQSFEKPFGTIIRKKVSKDELANKRHAVESVAIEDMSAFLTAALTSQPQLAINASTTHDNKGPMPSTERDRASQSTRRSTRTHQPAAGADSARTSRRLEVAAAAGTAKGQQDTATLRTFFQTLLKDKKGDDPKDHPSGIPTTPPQSVETNEKAGDV